MVAIDCQKSYGKNVYFFADVPAYDDIFKDSDDEGDEEDEERIGEDRFDDEKVDGQNKRRRFEEGKRKIF